MAHSALLRLPREIRNIILKHVLCWPDTLHLLQELVCEEEEPGSRCELHFRATCGTITHPFPDIVNLLLVNRQLHAEALEIFFKHNTFTFSCFPNQILDFMKRFPPDALQKIQWLRFMAPSMQVVVSVSRWYGVWGEHPVEQYVHWEEILQIMSQMRLKEVTVETIAWPDHFDSFYWPVLRRIIGWMEDGKITGAVRLTAHYGYHPQLDVEGLGEIRMMRMRWPEARKNKELEAWRFAAEETDEWELKLDELMQEAEKEKETLRFVTRYEKGNPKYHENLSVVVLEREC